MGKCECYIHSLKQGEKHVLGEARIIKRLGDNDYLAEYNGVRCHAISIRLSGSSLWTMCTGSFASPRQTVPDKMAARGRRKACLLLPGRRTQYE